MKVLVTGADGLVGSAFVEYLKNNTDWQIYAVSRQHGFSKLADINPLYYYCDLTWDSSVTLMLNQLAPDIIIHCAARANNAAHSDSYINNVESTYNLIKGIENSWTNIKPTFINLSSVVVYGRYHEVYPPTESCHLIPQSPYALSKQTSEDILYYGLYHQIISKLINLRCCAIVGKKTTHGMIHDVQLKIIGEQPELVLFGSDPGSIKPFVHIDDVVGAALYILNGYAQYEHYSSGTFNVCPNDNISVKDVATAMMDKIGIQKNIVWNESVKFKGDNLFIKCNNDLLNKIGYELKYKTSKEAILAIL